jgi:hypothetical protein
LKIAYFGLPLGALLLSEDGHELGPVVLSPIAAPGRRRLSQRPGSLRVQNQEMSRSNELAAIVASMRASKSSAALSASSTPGSRWLRRRLPGAAMGDSTTGPLVLDP